MLMETASDGLVFDCPPVERRGAPWRYAKYHSGSVPRIASRQGQHTPLVLITAGYSQRRQWPSLRPLTFHAAHIVHRPRRSTAPQLWQ
jgi:hypothetical protein